MQYIYDQNGWQTIPFRAAHTYIAHIKEYLRGSEVTRKLYVAVHFAAENKSSASHLHYTVKIESIAIRTD